MWMRFLQISFLVSISILSGTTLVWAESSKDNARRGKAVWSAFECAALANTVELPEERIRLFTFGYGQGQKFIAAWEAAKIQDVDVRKEVPMVVMWLLDGPSPDFVLGRLYERASDSGTTQDVYELDGKPNLT